MKSKSLSKSQFIRGLQCHKSLWLYKNNPDLRGQPDASLQAIFDQGTNVGVLAQKLFPGGTEIEFEGTSFDEKIAKTKELVESGVKTIYEATFKYDDVLVMVDILHKGRRGWELYEVKSSTKTEKVHGNDVAVQYYVLNGSGLKLRKASLTHINNQYTRQGDLDIKRLFTTVDMTHDVIQMQKQVKKDLRLMRNALNRQIPQIDIDPYRCNEPHECDFKDHCWAHLPTPSVFNLSGLHKPKKMELYARGIVKLKDLPSDYPLNPFQKAQVKAEGSNEDIIDREAIRDFLEEEISYPLYFLDFETFNPAIPQFDNSRPYERIPFQYSLHWTKKERGKLNHTEFLAREGTDPRKELAKKLIADIPGDVCVLAYNSGFEKGVIKTLAGQFPKYAKRLMNIHDHISDLMTPFLKAYVYRKSMQGSYSIKYVLPAFIPDDPKLDYKKLEISDGGQASNTYASLHLIKDQKVVKKTKKRLLEYCKLDTLAMVSLLGKLRELAED